MGRAEWQLGDRVIPMPGVEERKALLLSESTASLIDALQSGPLDDAALRELIEGVAERTGAGGAVLFVIPPGVANPRRGLRRAWSGVADRLADRIVLPHAIADLCATPGVARALTDGMRDPLAIGRVFPPLRKTLRRGLAVGLGSPRRTLGVLVLGFDDPPADELGAALEALAARLSPILEADLLAREADVGEAKYRVLMGGAADAITLYDPAEDRLVDVNPAAEAMFGGTREQLLVKPPIELLVYLRTASLSEVDPGRPREAHVRRADGSDRPFEVTSRVVRMGGRAVILSIYRDLSERRKAEAALRESEERYALAVEGANDGLWDWDVGGGNVYFSPRWKAMLGYGDDEVGSTPGEWFRRIHPDDLERMRAAISAHLEGLIAGTRFVDRDPRM